jgi:signal transduction histidine kinase/ligand-binding sensor domain-containing protein
MVVASRWTKRKRLIWRLAVVFFAVALAVPATALSPWKSFSQYSRTVWNQQQGLPQDTITAIAQTGDGYLWLGTNEGLARFDGYEFVVYSEVNGDLPSNSVKALTVGSDDSLWVGTANGLVRFVKSGAEHHTYTTSNGLPSNAIDELCVDHAGNIWIAAGGALAMFNGQGFTSFLPNRDIPITVRTVYEDSHSNLWVAGLGGVVRRSGNKFVSAMPWNSLDGDLITRLSIDRRGNLWVAGSMGLVERSPDNKIRKFTKRDGLPDNFVRAIWFDRDGNLWAGTNSGLARLRDDHFVAEGSGELIRCLFEDSEHDLWVGSSSSLSRIRDDIFTVYGTAEGFPSDSPNAVFEDRDHRIWVGFHDNVLLSMTRSGLRVFTPADGFPAAEVFSVRQSRSGDLLLSTRAGFVRMHGTTFHTYVPPDRFRREEIFDSIEDSSGAIWLALPNGLGRLADGKMQLVIPGGSLGLTSVVTLYESRDGAIWAGTYDQGLWRVKGEDKRIFTTENGLSSNKIRCIFEDRDGALWIATFEGGLNEYVNGKFRHFTARDGLLSSNITSIVDDGESLWLATTRGICRISKDQLRAFAEKRISKLHPVNYGAEDGLRSAQASPGYPVAGGGIQSSDGLLWFPTTKGLAVFDPRVRRQRSLAPLVHLIDFAVDGKSMDVNGPLRLQPRSSTLRIRYTGVHLSAPERVEYFFKLEGVDRDWIEAGKRREINYNALAHGNYLFRMRAELPNGVVGEDSFRFEKLPKFYETAWFSILASLVLISFAWAIYQLRVRQLRYRFTFVLEERSRLAREIHDTLAQGFIGLSSQLEAVASVLPEDGESALKYLNLARKMVRHSITEARRAISDLRGTALEGGDLATALRSGAQIWTAGTDLVIDVDISGTGWGSLPHELQQHLLRITQEAVTNVIKHAGARKVVVKLHKEASKLHLQIVDDGHGFVRPDSFSLFHGHFGLIGMQERTERLGGEFRLASEIGEGTEVNVTVPVP